MTAVPPRPAAPDVDTDTGALREAIDSALCRCSPRCDADATTAMAALRDLIAERDQAVAAVELCPKCKGTGVMSRPPGIPADQPTWTSHTIGPYICNLCDGRMVLRRALDGDQ